MRNRYFSTRDLILMAALAALGGVAGTYINAIGDLLQSALGFPGSFQWAAGLHVLWLVLAAGLIKKPGAALFTGVLKGIVELLTGNTHGLLVVMVDITAGLLVEVGFLPFKDRQKLGGYLLAGGLGAASNVFVFQLFASIPADTLAYGAILLLALVAFISGIVFAGALGYILVNALRRSGAVRDQKVEPVSTRSYVILLVSAGLLIAAAWFFLFNSLKGPMVVEIHGAVDSPYQFSENDPGDGENSAKKAVDSQNSNSAEYPLIDIIEYARPDPAFELLLVKASDGYAFFITREELETNPSLLLSQSGSGADASFNLVGAENRKAWVRNVTELILVEPGKLPIDGALENPGYYDPADWQLQMDSAQLDIGEGPNKYQGVRLNQVLASMRPITDADDVSLDGDAGVTLSLDEIMENDDLRIFTVISGESMWYAAAYMDGQVLVPRLEGVHVK